MKMSRFAMRAFMIAACLTPTAFVVKSAFADDDESGDESESAATQGEAMTSADLPKKRRAVLEGLIKNDKILINVTAREMPASPDILNLGRRTVPALARCVADNVDNQLRASCANLLGRLGDKAALPALHSALEAWDAHVRRAAIDALRKVPDRSSFLPLSKILEREDEEGGNIAAALDALGVLSDKRAVPLLEKHLRDDKDPYVRSAAFRGLWKTRHIMARSNVIAFLKLALNSDSPDLMLAATFSASEVRAPELVDPLVRIMKKSPDARTKNRAVYALGKIGDRSATAALVKHLPKVRESRMLNNIAFALERLDSKAFFQAAEGLITHQQAQIRFNTAFVLGDVRRPEGLPLLKGALSDQNDGVKLNAVSAIGKLDTQDGVALLEHYVDDSNAGLQQAAIYALYALSAMKRTDLVFKKIYDAHKDKPEFASARLDAAVALGRAHDPRVTTDLMTCLELRTCSAWQVDGALRASNLPEIPGRVLVTWVKDRPEVTDLVGALKPQGASTVALGKAKAGLALRDLPGTINALDLAGDLGDQSALDVLRPLLGHENARLRAHASVALARWGDTSADAVILRDLENAPHDQLPHAVRLLSRVNETAARTRLLPELVKRIAQSDRDLSVAAAAVQLAWDPDAGVFSLLNALGSTERRERDLAEMYLRRSTHPKTTELLRRALSRETRTPVRDQLRRILDLRAAAETSSHTATGMPMQAHKYHR